MFYRGRFILPKVSFFIADTCVVVLEHAQQYQTFSELHLNARKRGVEIELQKGEKTSVSMQLKSAAKQFKSTNSRSRIV